MSTLEGVVVGAGVRGRWAYGGYAATFPDDLRLVGVAEPDAERRDGFAADHGIPHERRFADWRDLVAAGRLADVAINATRDEHHLDSTLALLDAGYDVLLEKPMASTLSGCVALVRAAREHGRILRIGHVLRHTELFRVVHDLVGSGRLGRVVTVDHRENVSALHMAHSYVRGNWRRSDETAPMLLAKCCHDLDLLQWNVGRPVRRMASFGALTHFRAEHAPEGAPHRCLDGCPVADDCIWYAPRLYLAEDAGGLPVGRFLVGGETAEETRAALHTSPYGRCVYHSDNDVVDHQVAILEFDDDTTATLTMHGHSDEECRTLRYDGTRATLHAKFAYGADDWVRVRDHGSGQVEEVPLGSRSDSGHGGGDFGLIRDFLRTVRGEPTEVQTSPEEVLESHLLAFAGEQARVEAGLVDMARFREQAWARA